MKRIRLQRRIQFKRILVQLFVIISVGGIIKISDELLARLTFVTLAAFMQVLFCIMGAVIIDIVLHEVFTM